MLSESAKKETMRIKLSKPLPLSDIASLVNGRLIQSKNAIIKFISINSKITEPKDLFIPIKGQIYDGENFAQELKEKGCFILGENIDTADILVADTKRSLLDLANAFNKNLPYILYRIGITGSVGKSTTKDFLSILLSEKYKVHKNDGNKNNDIGMPLTLLSAPEESQILISEMGMNHMGEIKKLSECLMPNLGIITNIGRAHIGNLGSRENIANAKLEILCGMKSGKLIIPYDEPLLSCVKEKNTFSTSTKEADFYIEEGKGNEVFIYQNQKLICNASFGLSEKHFKNCLIAACAIAINCGLSCDELVSGISKISRENLRQFDICRENILFCADYYNSSPESVAASIEGVQKRYPNQKKSLLLGDMLELGNESDAIHQEVGANIPRGVFDKLFLFGSHAQQIGIGALGKSFGVEKIFLNTNITQPEITARQIRENCDAGEIILMKASRGVHLERVLDLFSKD